MSGFLHLLRRLFEGLLAPLDHLPEWLALTAVAVVTGVVLLLLVRATTPQRLVERTRNRMMSAIYETRLFLDNPRRLIIAQGRLLLWGLAYIGTLLPALAIATVPLGLLYLHLDARFGLMPLPTRGALVVELALADGVDPRNVQIQASPGVQITSPVVGVPSRHNAYVRLALREPGAHQLTLQVRHVRPPSGETSDIAPVTKRLDAGYGPFSPHRVSGAALLWDATLEPPLPDGHAFQRLSVVHAPRTDTWLGMPWWLYWLLAATVAALVLRKPLGVEI